MSPHPAQSITACRDPTSPTQSPAAPGSAKLECHPSQNPHRHYKLPDTPASAFPVSSNPHPVDPALASSASNEMAHSRATISPASPRAHPPISQPAPPQPYSRKSPPAPEN